MSSGFGIYPIEEVEVFKISYPFPIVVKKLKYSWMGREFY